MTDVSNPHEEDTRFPGAPHMDAQAVMEWILRQALEGVPPFAPADELVARIRQECPDVSPRTQAETLIRRESYKNFSTGFVTGLGGFITLPAAIPSSLVASWLLQARLVAAIAKLGGYDLEDPRIRKLVLWALFGDAVKEMLKTAGVPLVKQFGTRVMIGLPAHIILAVERKLGLLFLERATRTAAGGLIKAIPVLGGTVSGMVDAAVLRRVGNVALEWFLPETPDVPTANESPDASSPA